MALIASDCAPSETVPYTPGGPIERYIEFVLMGRKLIFMAIVTFLNEERNAFNCAQDPQIPICVQTFLMHLVSIFERSY